MNRMNSTDQIQTLQQLKSEFDQLWLDIQPHCAICTEPDCMGYINVFPEEEEALLNIGVQTIQINGPTGPIFIDSYPRNEQNEIIVNREKNLCPLRNEKGCCTIHMVRPIVCHLYPVGLETLENGTIAWVLHTDCAYVQAKLELKETELLLEKIRGILGRLSYSLSQLMFLEYKKADSLTQLPDEPNAFIVIKEVKMNG